MDSLVDQGAFIDFSDNFISYHTIVFIVSKPDQFAWTRLNVQYQGLPLVAGRRIELGDTLRFSAPAMKDDGGCCEPYLKDLGNIEFIDNH